jgi:hypothetical protein
MSDINQTIELMDVDSLSPDDGALPARTGNLPHIANSNACGSRQGPVEDERIGQVQRTAQSDSMNRGALSEVIAKVNKLWDADKRVIFEDCAHALSLCDVGADGADVFVKDMQANIVEVATDQRWDALKENGIQAVQAIWHLSCRNIVRFMQAGDSCMNKCLRLMANSGRILYTSGGHQLYRDFINVMGPELERLLLGYSLHEYLFSQIYQNEADLTCILECCEKTHRQREDAYSFPERLAARLHYLIAQTNADNVAECMLDKRNRQFSSFGMERLCKFIQRCSPDVVDGIHEAWRSLAVDCCHSHKLLVRRVGLEIFACLAQFAPIKAAKWFVEQNFAHGQNSAIMSSSTMRPPGTNSDQTGAQSVLVIMTGERAHEKLVDLVRGFIYTLECSKSGSPTVETEILDKVLATCLGTNQHPTKEVRDAFRAAVAKLALTMTHDIDQDLAQPEAPVTHRVAVAAYVVEKVLDGLGNGIDGATELTLALLREWEYDQISISCPSPKHLVCSAVWNTVALLAQRTLALLCTAFITPELADKHDTLLHSLCMCLQAGPSMGRPGSRRDLAPDMRQIVNFCKHHIEMLVSCMFYACLYAYTTHFALAGLMYVCIIRMYVCMYSYVYVKSAPVHVDAGVLIHLRI